MKNTNYRDTDRLAERYYDRIQDELDEGLEAIDELDELDEDRILQREYNQ